MCTGTHNYIPVENVAKFEVFMRVDGQRVENVFYANNPASWSSGDLAYVAGVIDTWAREVYMPCVGVQVTYIETKATDLTTSTGAVATVGPVTPVAGGITGGEMYPNNCAAVVSLNTAKRGRSYRGRTFVPGLRSTLVAANTLTTAAQTALHAAIFALYNTFGEAGCVWCVVSLCNGKAWRTAGVWTQIETVSVNPTVASQRRRLPGRGN